ncbi:MAG: cyclic nucleotide-binding domain-containing protein [Anaerolineaceae bacterium]|nr:cyclic nucleotide-binding domain-containing protein [Anaerolineaceae bacterium]
MGKLSLYLRGTDLFFNLTNTQLEMVENICDDCLYKKGDAIVSENTPGKELFLIIDGKVEIIVNPGMVSPDPKMMASPAVIATLRQGQSFGEMAIVDEGLRSATVRASTKTTRVLRIEREKFLMLCNTFPDLGYHVMYNLAAEMALKIRNADLSIREALLYKKIV